jgi:hypothetical protein
VRFESIGALADELACCKSVWLSVKARAVVRMVQYMQTDVACSGAQYTEFLSTALPPAERAALLPSISELVLQYGVDFEVAFQVGCCKHQF